MADSVPASVDAFIKRWSSTGLNEQQGAQSHFIDLCRLLDVSTPTDADQSGTTYCFEKGATKATGGDGWADVWHRGRFAWEYKGPRKNLADAFRQLQQYVGALENPPLLVTCDLQRFEITTNWTNTVSERHILTLEDLRDPEKLAKLRAVFSNPEKLRPGRTRQKLTEDVAGEFATLAQRLRERPLRDGAEPAALDVAHFVIRLMFCMYAEDADLLPDRLFTELLTSLKHDPSESAEAFKNLFAAMRRGGRFEPRRVSRRPFRLSHAAMAGSSSIA